MTKLKHDFHRSYRIFPPMDLVANTHFALASAAHHLARLRVSLNSPGMQMLWEEDKTLDARARAVARRREPVPPAPAGVLVGAHGNLRHDVAVGELRISIGYRRAPSTVSKPAPEVRESTERIGCQIRAVENAWDSDWYFEVRAYRNLAYRAALNVLTAIAVRSEGDWLSSVASLWPVREGQPQCEPIEQQLSAYLANMWQLESTLFTR